MPFKKNLPYLILFLIFVIHLFLRFYQLETRFSFSTDQVRMAWIMKGMIVDHVLPIVGPPNKLGSGIYVGPAYYYLISFFYYFTNLDPIAAALFAGVTSIFSFLILFYIVWKLSSIKIALMAVFINTVSFSGVQFDRTQWEMNFIPPVALVAFYALYRIINGKEKYIFLLALSLGFAFHVHITIAVFLSMITLLALPFFPRTKKMIKYAFVSFLIFLLLFSPLILKSLQTQNAFSGNVFQYLKTSSHGFHLRRFLQLTPDAFIQFESFFTFPFLRLLSFFLLPIFIVVYSRSLPAKKKIPICYLSSLFFIVPWLVLSIYSGEISDYYFSTNRFLALFIISYLLMKLFFLKKVFVTISLVIFIFGYSYLNLNKFFTLQKFSLQNSRTGVKNAIEKGKVINFESENPQSYLYYIYTRKK